MLLLLNYNSHKRHTTPYTQFPVNRFDVTITDRRSLSHRVVGGSFVRSFVRSFAYPTSFRKAVDPTTTTTTQNQKKTTLPTYTPSHCNRNWPNISDGNSNSNNLFYINQLQVITDKMDTILPNILHTIGNTPLIRLNRIPQSYGIKCEVCEYLLFFFYLFLKVSWNDLVTLVYLLWTWTSYYCCYCCVIYIAKAGGVTCLFEWKEIVQLKLFSYNLHSFLVDINKIKLFI